MLTRHVALVSEESAITLSELSIVAAALQKQASRDFAPHWKIDATVTAFSRLEDVPLDYWPVVIKDNIHAPGASGYHEDQHGQPFALVQYEQGWELTASHEVFEMLADPFGRRLVAGKSPKSGQGRVRFLVEVCDPSEAEAYAYTINGVTVSDFYTPHYFDPVTTPGVRYSYTGAITKPRQVLKGGYLSWYDPTSHSWWQRTFFGSSATDRQLGKLNAHNGNLREAVDLLTHPQGVAALDTTRKAGGKASGKQRMSAAQSDFMIETKPALARAGELREAITVVTQE